ncbi:MAG: bactofilin family protein [Gammaproteobacteria bacterium]
MNSGKRRSRARIDTLVGQRTEVHGDVRFSGGLHVDGTVKGNVVAESGSDAVLTLSEGGCIEGEVRVPTVILDGRVNGDVHAADRVELAAHARVTGNVYYNLIEMAVGAAVNGKLVHRVDGAKPAAVALDKGGGDVDDEPAGPVARANS